MSPSELVGVWRLVSFRDLDDGGNTSEGPLGRRPSGLLFYTADGHVSVHMMRTDGRGPAGDPAAPAQTYLSYAGTWRRVNDQVVHTITVAPDPQWLGSEQVRDLTLGPAGLTLIGTGPTGRTGRRALRWRRVATGRQRPGAPRS